ncbi:titin homolog isoform X1 [Carassius gibelio]|uniref:titin homolog isoform X1 n=1 Tax=Carassius gibelio TaxID=101364 RepID=UPI0022776D24|nr:titin homolog isoform X1 [Carassius gibelio]
MSLAEQSQQWFPTSVQVTVLQARGLRTKGKNGTNDAYAVMQVAKDKFSTSVAEKTVAPVWKEEAAFDLPLFHPSNAERCTLQVCVMHRALMGPDKVLGQATVNLLELQDNKSRNKTEWFKLMGKTGKADKDRGEVLLDIQFMKNNMTASMYDLSGQDKSRSRLGKLKDKLKGKKKDGMSDSASAIVPSVSQVLTDSEGEEPDSTPGAKKKNKLKSLFKPKPSLQRNISQSMSTLATLPEKDSAISLSRSSGLNVESPEGKKKFKFLKHKRTESSDSKVSQGTGSLGLGMVQSNVCINGSHVYTEEPESRGSRAGSAFSLNSSGHGSMEDLRRGHDRKTSSTSVDSLKTSDLQTQENAVEQMQRRQEEQRKREAEVRKRLEEERRQAEEEERKEEERKQIEEKERLEREEERKRLEREEEERRRIEREEERKRIEKEEERKLIEKEEERKRIAREEERKQIEEKKRLEREEERKRLEREEEERKMIEREEERQRISREEERKQMEREEERKRIEREEEMKQIEEKKRLEREEERKRLEREEEERKRIEREEERKRIEKEEERKLIEREEERRRIAREEERKQMEIEEERKRIEREEERKQIEEKKRLEREEERKRLEREEEERKRIEREEERKRIEREEERKKEEERRRIEAEDRERKRIEQEEMIRIKNKQEEERRRAEEERIKEEKRNRMEEEEKEKARKEEEQRRMEEERLENEKLRKEEETRMIEMERRRAEEEERLQKEKEKLEAEEKRKRMEEEERRLSEQKERREQERLRLEKEKLELENKRMEERMREEQARKKADEEEEKRKLKEKADQERIRQEKVEMERQKEEQEQRPVVKPRSARLNKSKKAPGEINPDYVPSASPFEDPLSFDESYTNPTVSQTEALNQSTKVSAVKPSSSVSGISFSQASIPNTNPFLDDSDVDSGNTEKVVNFGDTTERSDKKRRAPMPPLNKKTQMGKTDIPPRAPPIPEATQAFLSRGSEDDGDMDSCSLQRDKRPAPLPPKNKQEVQNGHAVQSTTPLHTGEQRTTRFQEKDQTTKVRPVLQDESRTSDAVNSGNTSLTNLSQGHPSNRQETNPFIFTEVKTTKHNKGPAPKPLLQSKCCKTSASETEPNNLARSNFHLTGHKTIAPSISCIDQLDELTDNLDDLLASEEPSTKPEPVHPDDLSSDLPEKSKLVFLGEDVPSRSDPVIGKVLCNVNDPKNTENVLLESGVFKKKSRAPLPPAKSASGQQPEAPLNSTSQPNIQDQDKSLTINSSKSTSCFTESLVKSSSTSSQVLPLLRMEAGHGSGHRPLPPARVSTIEVQPFTGQKNGSESERAGDPSFKPCRPHAVKPLSTTDKQPDLRETQDGSRPAKITDGIQVKMKAPEAKGNGPYSQLTYEELINLLEKQKQQLSQKDAKIGELELYIDNLLVRVMEDSPNILMSLSSMKKSV